MLSSLAGAASLSTVLLWLAVPVGLVAGTYTALLFRQCRGRELWRAPLLSVDLAAQCLLCSGALLALVPSGLGVGPQLRRAAAVALAIGLALHVAVAARELFWRHSAGDAREAARLVTAGPFRAVFWVVAAGVGCAAPAVLLVAEPFAPATISAVLTGVAGACGLAGLLAFEWCFVMGGQAVANS
jgi:Ni/Fe-hydrogenase subunit HybB-like protein